MLQPWQSQHVSVQPMLHHTVAQAQLDLVLRTVPEKRGNTSCISRWPYRRGYWVLNCGENMRELQHLASHASHLVQSSWISDWTHYIHTININQYNLHQSTYCKYLQALNFTQSSVDSMAVCSVSLALAHPHNHGAKRSLHSSCVVLNICLLLSCWCHDCCKGRKSD